MTCVVGRGKSKRKEVDALVIRRMKKPITTRTKSSREVYLRPWRKVMNIIWGYVVWGCQRDN